MLTTKDLAPVMVAVHLRQSADQAQRSVRVDQTLAASSLLGSETVSLTL